MSDLPELIEKLPKDAQDIFVSAYAYAFQHGESMGESKNIAWDAVFSVFVPSNIGNYHMKSGWDEKI